MPDRHKMQLFARYVTGAEEWHCPTCGRRLVVQSPAGSEAVALDRGDQYILVWGALIGTVPLTKIVLEAGDGQAIHHGRANAQASVAAEPSAETPDVAGVDGANDEMPDDLLSSWTQGLEGIDFDSL